MNAFIVMEMFFNIGYWAHEIRVARTQHWL